MSLRISKPHDRLGEEVYNAIAQNPGIPERKLAEILEIQQGVKLRKILSEMVEQNLIWVRRAIYQTGCVTIFQNTLYINK